MRDTLIITLVHHPNFGYLLQPVFALYRADIESHVIAETARTTSATYKDLTENEQTVVRLADRYSDKELMRSFSHEKSEADFLRKISSTDIEIYIRPFIEKKQEKLIEIIRKINTPVFLREKISIRDFRAGQALDVLKEPSRMVFRFCHAETFTYNATVRNGTSNVELYGQFFAPLVSDPAVAVIGRQLHYFNDVDEKKLRPFFRKKQIEVPSRSVPGYIRSFVVQCVKNYEVKGEGISIFEQAYNPVAVLTLETDFDLQPILNLQFHYGMHRFAIDRPYKKEVEVAEETGDLSIGWFFRDEVWEKEHISMLENGGLSRSRTGQFYLASGNKKQGTDSLGLVEWINRNGKLLENFELKQSLGKLVYYTGEIDLQLTVSDTNDWFDIHCVACFGDVEIPFIQFREHILNNIREYLLPDGCIAVLPMEWFSRFGEMFRYGTVSGNILCLSNFDFKGKELAENGFFSEEKVELKHYSVDIPAALNVTLRPYQENGFRWLAYLQQNGFGGCLADDMGLGKTLQTITLLLHIYAGTSEIPKWKNGRPRQLSLFDDFTTDGTDDREIIVKNELPPTLIVMPTSLIHNWLSELKKFAPVLEVYVHTGGNRLQNDDFKREISRYQVVLTSYGIVRQDIDLLRNCYFHYLVLDESQYIKNPDSQIFDCIKQLHSTYKLALTGTPVENSLSDLWSQMDFLNDGILGKHREFKARFTEADVINDDDARQKLLKIIDPFILRRSKEEVAPELPPLTEEIMYCEMDAEQAALYNKEKNMIRNDLLEQLTESNKSYAAATLSSLMRLRLLANHPAIFLPDYEGGSAKFEQIVAQAEIIFAGQHKVLVFSSFVKHLQLFADYFDNRGWRYAWLTGSTTDRKGEIDKFNADKNVRAFFISLKAGGTGLNLTAADYVFIIDPWWNPAAEMQAVSRAHRIGQNKKVTLYRFIVKGTVEEKIQRLQRYKTTLTDAFVRPQLSMKEIQDLLD